MERVSLSLYGGVIQNLLAEILVKRHRERGGVGIETADSILPRDFFNHLAAHPLPEVICDREDAERANEVIRFINRTDDILNLKRGLLLLLKLGKSTGHRPFSMELYNPELLEMEEEG